MGEEPYRIVVTRVNIPGTFYALSTIGLSRDECNNCRWETILRHFMLLMREMQLFNEAQRSFPGTYFACAKFQESSIQVICPPACPPYRLVCRCQPVFPET